MSKLPELPEIKSSVLPALNGGSPRNVAPLQQDVAGLHQTLNAMLAYLRAKYPEDAL